MIDSHRPASSPPVNIHASKARTLAIPVVLLITVAGCSSTSSEQPNTAPQTPPSVTLRWKLDTADELIYRQIFRTETETSQRLGSMGSELEFTQRWNVLEVNGDRDATIRITTERVSMTLQMPMGTMSFDSADATASTAPGLDLLANLVGTSQVVVMGQRGGIKEVRGLEEMRDALLGGTDNPMISSLLASSMNVEAMRANLEKAIPGFPAEPIVVGSRWDVSSDISMPPFGAANTELAYELIGIEPEGDDTIATISSTGVTSADGAGAGFAGLPNQALEISQTGTAEFSANLGRFLRSETVSTMTTTLPIGGQQIDMTSNTTIIMELVDEAGQPLYRRESQR